MLRVSHIPYAISRRPLSVVRQNLKDANRVSFSVHCVFPHANECYQVSSAVHHDCKPVGLTVVLKLYAQPSRRSAWLPNVGVAGTRSGFSPRTPRHHSVIFMSLSFRRAHCSCPNSTSSGGDQSHCRAWPPGHSRRPRQHRPGRIRPRFSRPRGPTHTRR